MSFFINLPDVFIEKAKKLGVFEVDIEENFIRGSGKGGQKINKTSNNVWLKHLPTGMEVKVQKHRELFNNRLSAYKLLINKIEQLKLGKQSELQKKIFKLRKQKQKRSKRAKEKILVEKRHRSEIKGNRANLTNQNL